MVSGNILLCISEHFCQFLSINRQNISLKKVNIYQRDYSNFETQAFRNGQYESDGTFFVGIFGKLNAIILIIYSSQPFNVVCEPQVFALRGSD